MDESTCIKACMRLNLPLKEILGNYKCYKDGLGNCYQNGRNGDGASLICKMLATLQGFRLRSGGGGVNVGKKIWNPSICSPDDATGFKYDKVERL